MYFNLLNPFWLLTKTFLNLGGAAAAVGIASGLSSLFGGGDSGPSPSTGTTAGGTVYDPFAQYRQQFGGQLAAMMSPGAQFTTSDPSYAFRYNQGLEAVNRSLGAQHLLGSGNRLYELMNYGQGAASQEFGNQFNRLASLAGTSQTMGSSYGGLQAKQQQGGWDALAQGLSSMVGGVGGYGSTGTVFNPTGFGTGVGGSGYSAASMGGIGSEQAQMLASQWM